ncbi:hypothetical protein ACSV9I_05220 [Rhizobium sp. G187]|uniref:hypothetical protein n=1 Tax=Rhizobium sp. G187 TaxID=3451352 RepID=UPI003EE58D03
MAKEAIPQKNSAELTPRIVGRFEPRAGLRDFVFTTADGFLPGTFLVEDAILKNSLTETLEAGTYQRMQAILRQHGQRLAAYLTQE